MARQPSKPTRLLDPDARGTIAVTAGRSEVLQAMCGICGVEVAGPADSFPSVGRALNAMLRSFDMQQAAESSAFPLAIWNQGIWTIIEDPRDVLPSDASVLQQIAVQARGQLVARIMRARDRCYGFTYYDEARCRRMFLKVADAVVEDEGRLASEEPPIRIDPRSCIDAAWRRLVPEDEPVDIEVRLFRPTGVID